MGASYVDAQWGVLSPARRDPAMVQGCPPTTARQRVPAGSSIPSFKSKSYKARRGGTSIDLTPALWRPSQEDPELEAVLANVTRP